MHLYRKFVQLLYSSKVDLYQEEIKRRNYNSINAFLLVGTVVSLMVLLYGLALSNIVTFNTEFFIMFCYCTILLLLSTFLLKKHKYYTTLVFYLIMTPLMIMAIMMGTFLDRTQPSITIMVFLCVLPIFLLDKLWRILLYITGSALIYGICCYIAKDTQMFLADMVDLVTFYFLALGVNSYVFRERISSVETFVRYRIKSETDILTDIYNRGAGVEKIEALMAQKVNGAFLILDVDDFKKINDEYGHITGDVVLQELARKLKDFFAENGIVLRMGGDEFAVYIKNLTDKEQIETQLKQFFEEVKHVQLPYAGKCLSISLGCSVHLSDSEDFEQLYNKSDDCLYQAKKAGKGRFKITQ